MAQPTRAQRGERYPKGTYPPYIQLAEAFDLVTQIYEQGGGQASYDMMSRLTGNSSSSSSFFKKLAAVKAYGLVTDANKIVSLTDEGMAIAAPISPEAARSARKLAFLNVDVFSRIYERHKGKLLPADEFLRNIIEQDQRIPRDLSASWVSAFKQGAAAAGLLYERPDAKTQIMESPTGERAALQEAKDSTLVVPREQQRPDVETASFEPATTVPFAACGHNTRIQLSSGRYAEFSIPDSLTGRDANKLKSALDGLKAIIDSMVSDENEGSLSKVAPLSPPV